MQNMILQKCAWASIQTTVAYTKHSHTHTHTHIHVYVYIHFGPFPMVKRDKVDGGCCV